MLWLKERLFIPFDEAEKLFQALERDHLVDIDDFLLKLGKKPHGFICRARNGQVCAHWKFCQEFAGHCRLIYLL